MSCKEVAVFKFNVDCLATVIELNHRLVAEMKAASGGALLNYEILQSPDDPKIITRLIEWSSMSAAHATILKWEGFPSGLEFSEAVDREIFYDFLEKR